MHSDFKANFGQLLEENNSFSMHHRIIQTLAIEIFKLLNGLYPPKLNEVFQVKPSAPYFPRDKNELYNKNPKTMTYRTESIYFFAPKIWSTVPEEIKNCKLLDLSFKKSIRKWKLTCNMLVIYKEM